MRWAATQQDGEDIEQVLRTSWDFVGLRAPDFVMLSIRTPHEPFEVMDQVVQFLKTIKAKTVVCGLEETDEDESGELISVSLTCAHLPDVDVRLHPIQSMTHFRDTAACKEWIGIEPELQPVFMGFTAMANNDVESLLGQMDKAYPNASKTAGRFALCFGLQNGQVVDAQLGAQGGVMISFAGDIEAKIVVTQGARPVGAPLVVTRCRDNKVLELDGRPALRVMQAVYDTMKPNEKAMFQTHPLCGLGVLDARGRVGGYRIARITGVHRDSGMFAIPSSVKNHQTLQFFVRGPSVVADELSECFSGQDVMPRTRGAIVLKSNWSASLGPFGTRPLCTGVVDAKTVYGPMAGRTYPMSDAAVFTLFKKRDWS